MLCLDPKKLEDQSRDVKRHARLCH